MVLRNVTLGPALLVTMQAVYLNSREPGCILCQQMFRIYLKVQLSSYSLLEIVAPYARAAPILLVMGEWVVEQRAPPLDSQCLTSGLKVAQQPQLALLQPAFMPQAPLKLSIQIVRVTIVAP
jgi:hypothetical protein